MSENLAYICGIRRIGIGVEAGWLDDEIVGNAAGRGVRIGVAVDDVETICRVRFTDQLDRGVDGGEGPVEPDAHGLALRQY